MFFAFIGELFLGYVISSLYTQMDNKKELLKDKRVIKNVKKEIKNYYNDFELKNTNTIIDSNEFYKYIKYHKPIEHLIDYLISPSVSAEINDRALFDDHIKKALSYLNTEGQTLSYANRNLIISFHKDIYKIIVNSLNKSFNLAESYHLKILQNEHRKIVDIVKSEEEKTRKESKENANALKNLIREEFSSLKISMQNDNGEDSTLVIDNNKNGEYLLETYINIQDLSLFTNAAELLNHVVWTCEEKVFDITKILIIQDKNIVKEIKNTKIETDTSMLLSIIRIKNNPTLIETLSDKNYKSFKVKIKPLDIILKCDILNERNELVYQNYKFKLTREKIGDITQTKWIDITENNTYTMNFIHEFNDKDIHELALNKTKRNVVEIGEEDFVDGNYKVSVNIECNNESSAYSSYHYYEIYKKLANCNTLKFLYSDNGSFMSSFNFNMGNTDADELGQYAAYYRKIHEIELFISSAFLLEDEGNLNVQEIVKNYHNIINNGYSISYNKMRIPMILDEDAKNKITPDTIISLIPDNNELFGQKIFDDGLVITIPYFILEAENDSAVIKTDKYIIYTDKNKHSIEKIKEIITQEDERANNENII